MAATERAAARFAAALRPGDLVALIGPLGAGKTRLVEGLARGLGCRAAVRSPTFTLINEYHGRLALGHADLYRVDPAEVEALGLEEGLDRGVMVVEWGEKLPGPLLATALRLEIEIRSARVRAITAFPEGRGSGRASELAASWRRAARAASRSRP